MHPNPPKFSAARISSLEWRVYDAHNRPVAVAGSLVAALAWMNAQAPQASAWAA